MRELGIAQLTQGITHLSYPNTIKLKLSHFDDTDLELKLPISKNSDKGFAPNHIEVNYYIGSVSISTRIPEVDNTETFKETDQVVEFLEELVEAFATGDWQFPPFLVESELSEYELEELEKIDPQWVKDYKRGGS